MQFTSSQAYAKRSVPTLAGEGSVTNWASKLAAWLGVESANVQRGVQRAASRTVTTSVTATAADGLILADATGGAITITLPDPKTVPDLVICVKRLNGGGNNVTIGGTVDGTLNRTLAAQYATMIIWSHSPSTGSAFWYRIGVI